MLIDVLDPSSPIARKMNVTDRMMNTPNTAPLVLAEAIVMYSVKIVHDSRYSPTAWCAVAGGRPAAMNLTRAAKDSQKAP